MRFVLRVGRTKVVGEAEATNPRFSRPHVVEPRGEINGSSTVSVAARVVVDDALHICPCRNNSVTVVQYVARCV
eukprot:13892164-Heterocapsa_arctica.AAC.1